ncbi:MAG TPA: ABC transporter permease [Conexibacter sp.]|jgi:ABC-2 type transport system permease protein
MRWLLLKDLQILRRSPLLVALLIVYPIMIALLIGAALSRGPSNPSIALVNQIPKQQRTFDLGGSNVNANEYLPQLSRSVDLVSASSRADAVRLVREGKVLAAVVLPTDIVGRLSSGRDQPKIDVIYNGEDPVKQRFVESVVKARLADANDALSKKYEQITIRYIDTLLDGGSIAAFGRQVPILGLRNSKKILDGVIATLPPRSRASLALQQVDSFATLAVDNLGVSTDVLRSVGEPIAVHQTLIGGRRTALDAYAIAIAATVSLMFLTVLLAAGLLALEREEHAFSRLVRGLVSRLGLLAEKIGLAALCSVAVTLLLLLVLGIFFVDLDLSRAPQWVVALGVGGIAFAALGVAIGGLAREVRAASLLAFLLSLPIAFLALVPSGAVSGWLSDAIRVVCAAFPFKPTLQALDIAVNAAPTSLGPPLLHLAALAAAYTLIARLALRRFA